MAIIVKDYVLDFTNPLRYVLMEFESVDGGLTYRYVYGLRRLHTVIYGIPQGVGAVVQWTYRNADGSVSITDSDPNDPDAQRIVKLFHHQNRLGTTDYLTDNISGRITSYVSYDDFGMLTAKAVIRLGQRELDLVTDFTGHFFDPVLGIYYARARMYDAANRRFMAIDPIKDGWNWFAYAGNNPIKYVDPTGLYYIQRIGVNTYTVIPQTSTHTLLRTIGEVTVIGGIFYNEYLRNRHNIVGGISLRPLTDLRARYISTHTKAVMENFLNKNFPNFARNLKPVTTALGALSTATSIHRIERIDTIIWQLLERVENGLDILTVTSPFGPKMLELTMGRAYAFILNLEHIFLNTFTANMSLYSILLQVAEGNRTIEFFTTRFFSQLVCQTGNVSVARRGEVYLRDFLQNANAHLDTLAQALHLYMRRGQDTELHSAPEPTSNQRNNLGDFFRENFVPR